MDLSTHTIPSSTGSTVLDEIAEVVGFGAAMKLSLMLGGIDLFVPADIKKAPRIIAAIGEEKAKALSEFYGGTTVFIQRGAGERAMVQHLASLKWTRQNIALELGIAERKVYRILERLRSDDQPTLPFIE